MKSVDVCLTHQDFDNYDHKGKIVVVIDVLRATSTINTLLFLGADHVKPVGSLEECKVLKDDDYIIMAERMGKKVEGFDYGNSPTKFKEENIKGRKVAIATSNGSKAIIKSEGSKRTILCSFLNIESVINLIKKYESDVLLLCSGWLGKTNLEDTLCAGGIVAGLDNFEIESDTALMAKALHDNTDDILETMKLSSHAKRLSGYDNKVDIEFCSRVNTQPIIPILNGNQIVLS
ncbi:MAG: 2-phosphosulfolactate phosphatase [Flammeovirgaceae bacterium]|nr:2-phosphosulfolactate phosphatase [Flammeovirgaceae bacterium]|tara:strand:+ start:417 stop:1115 length:699 start_codon:yes stop_codon:yes gene_type:complete